MEPARKYKVLYVTNYLDMSGQQQTVLHTAAHVDRNRFEAHLAANLTGGDRKLDNVLAREARAVSHIVLHDLPHLRLMPSPLFDLWTLIDLVRLIRAERVDIVQTFATKVALLGRLAARLAGAPIVIHYSHGWSFEYPPLPPPVRALFLGLEKIASRATDLFVTCNEALRDTGLRQRLGRPDQFAVVRSGWDLDRFLHVPMDAARLRASLGLPPSGPIVGTVMIFDPKKSPETIVRMAPAVLEAMPDTHFLIVGDGQMMPIVRSLVEELKLQDRVLLTGLRKDVAELMALMDVFVHPAWFDVLPHALIQAQATGRPVVSTRVGGIPEVIRDGETGLLVPPNDLPALTEAVIRLLRDAEQRARIGQAARRAVSSAYTIEAMVEAMEKLYNELIEAKLSPRMPERIRSTV